MLIIILSSFVIKWMWERVVEAQFGISWNGRAVVTLFFVLKEGYYALEQAYYVLEQAYYVLEQAYHVLEQACALKHVC